MDFRMSDVVTWTAQRADHSVTRRGKIVGVVPGGEQPVIPAGYYMHDESFCGPITRDHESYLVAVSTEVYWPQAYDLHKVDEAKELAEALSKFVNSIGNHPEDVVQHLAGDHRTLQQGITKFAVAWLERCAKMYDERDFDLRNEASSELGRKFMDRTTPQDRAMPFI